MSSLNPFTLLVVCVEAAVSESKKAVSAVAAAVVGVGLLCLPIESVQGQSSIPTVTEVDLDSFSFVSSADFRVTLSLENVFFRDYIYPFYWSGIYGNAKKWDWLSVTGSVADHVAGRVSLGPDQFQAYFYPGSRSDYYVCRFGFLDLDSDDLSIDEGLGWVEVWVWTGTATHSPSAYVYDSDGNSYDVDLAIDGYVISGPSWPYDD